MEPLLTVLENECVHLDRIRYHTTLTLLLLHGHEARFLPRAADEVHDAVDALTETELHRATLVAALAEKLGTDDELTLTELIRHAEATTAAQLRDLQARLQDHMSELTALTGSATVKAAVELDSIRRSLGRFSGVPVGAAAYGVVGSPPPARFEGSF